MQKITSIGEILFDIYGNTKTLGGAPFNFIYHVNKIWVVRILYLQLEMIMKGK